MKSFKTFFNSKFIKFNKTPIVWELNNNSDKSLYISTLQHGNERSGLKTGLYLLKHPEIFDGINVTLLPCLNVWGYLNDVRTNENGHDLNRDYKNAHQSETKNHIKYLNGKKWNFGLNLHESHSADGCFIYEPEEFEFPHYSDYILKSMNKVMDLDTTHKKYHNTQERDVLIDDRYKEKHWTESIYLTKNGTPCITLEVPSRFPINQRVQTYIAGIKMAINLLKTK